MTKNKNNLFKLIKSFGYAFRGIFYTLQDEQNMRVHFVCMIYMYSYLFLFDFFTVTKTQLAVIFLANGAVLAMELINTAIENTVDLITHDKKELAKTAKDAAAGAVLVFAIFSIAVGVAVLWQPDAFKALFNYYIEKPVRIGEFLVSALVFTAFIFKGFPVKKKKQEENK